MKNERILAINPGATSTKFAVYEGEKELLTKTTQHSVQELASFNKIFDQYTYRLDLILKVLREENIKLDTLSAVVGRGGLLKPLAGGTYQVNAEMVKDLEESKIGEHASNLGAIMAYNIAKEQKIAAYIVDPVSVDEMEPVARISGLAELPRVSLSHALNTKAVARKVASEMKKRYEDLNLIVAHLGTGVSVSSHRNGKMIDVNNSKEEGPFSPDRCGGLPANLLVQLCYSGKYTLEEMKGKLFGKGGIYAYLGTTDLREVEKMGAEGNEMAELLLDAQSYQVAKEIGAMATVLEGKVDNIILTGGMACSGRIVKDISRRVQFIAPIIVVPGEEELESLVLGTLRVLRSEEKPKIYC